MLIDLMKASVPIYDDVSLKGICYTSELKMDAVVTKLDGEAGVFYRALWSSPKDTTLWSWNGTETVSPLYQNEIAGCL